MNKNQMREKENKLLTTPTPPKEGLSEEKSQKVLGFGYITANSQMYNSLKDYRNTLKKNPTEAEKVIWEYLRNKEKDGIRTCRFIELGYDILRFTNEEVLENPRLVFFKIKNYLENKEEIIKDQIRKKELRTTPTPPKEGLSEEIIKIN